jgi:lipopolysaccharide transport system permease protein
MSRFRDMTVGDHFFCELLGRDISCDDILKYGRRAIEPLLRETLRDLATSPTVMIQPRRGFFNLDLAAVWEFRELLYFLVWRNVKVRYKQTLIGSAWAIIQPLMAMLIFTVIFGRFAKIPSDGLPYSIFAYTALLPWTYFSQAVTGSAASLIGNTNLVRKVYFPRLIIPLAEVAAPLIDFFISFLALLVMMAWFGIAPRWSVLALPLFLLLAMMTALAVGLWLSALNARYRDVGHAVPFLIQIWLYASPVVYPVSLIPEHWRLLYSLNPMVGVIEGFRWTLLGREVPAFGIIAVGAAVVVALLLGGIIFFKRMEHTFADVI